VLADVDLSILGREAEVFWRYEGDIRKEYGWVPEEVFQREMVRILRGVLDPPHIYYHSEYRERFEGRARANLEQAVARRGGA
jgi:predicted metal-dependent HD superfamily phosphohydrolase